MEIHQLPDEPPPPKRPPPELKPLLLELLLDELLVLLKLESRLLRLFLELFTLPKGFCPLSSMDRINTNIMPNGATIIPTTSFSKSTFASVNISNRTPSDHIVVTIKIEIADQNKQFSTNLSPYFR
jgi:hypothetical protein